MLIVRDMEFSPKRPRVIVPLFARDLAALSAQTAAAEASPVAELAELRLDPLPREAYTDALCAVRAALHKPLIVTIRTAARPRYKMPPTAPIRLMMALARLRSGLGVTSGISATAGER